MLATLLPYNDDKMENMPVPPESQREPTPESWRAHNAPHIEELKRRALEPELPWLVQAFRTWRANRAIKKRNGETFSNIGILAIHLMECDRQDGKRLVIARAPKNKPLRVVYEPLLPYPSRRHKK